MKKTVGGTDDGVLIGKKLVKERVTYFPDITFKHLTNNYFIHYFVDVR